MMLVNAFMEGSMADKNVVDFSAKRNKVIEKKRRSFERVMFDNILGCYTVIDNAGSMHPVGLVDISYDGFLFETPWSNANKKKFEVGQEISVRIYFSKKSYLPISVTIKYSNEFESNDGNIYMRYGCEFDQTTKSFEALRSFIQFIYKFSEHSCIDRGESKVYFL